MNSRSSAMLLLFISCVVGLLLLMRMNRSVDSGGTPAVPRAARNSTGLSPIASRPRIISDRRARQGGAGAQFARARDLMVSGTVLGLDNTPIANALVECKGQSTPEDGEEDPQGSERASGTHFDSQKTNIDGTFGVKTKTGTSVLIARKEGYAPSPPATLELREGDSTSGVVLRLDRPHAIDGRVVDGDNRPVPEARIWLSPVAPGGHTMRVACDKGGRFRAGNLWGGEYALHVTKTHYRGVESKRVKAGDSDVLVVLDAILDNMVMIGRVVDAKTRQPLREYTVTCKEDSRIDRSTTDSTFALRGLRPGDRRHVEVNAAGCLPDTREITAPDGKKEFWHIFEMGNGGVIRGRAVEEGTGEPLADVSVTVVGTASTSTSASGRFEFEQVRPGRQTVEITPPAPFLPKVETCGVDHGETADLGDVKFSKGGTIRGRVLRRPGNVPVPGVVVKGEPDSQQMSGSDGGFEFADLAPGEYGICLPEYKQCSIVELAYGETIERDVFIGEATLKGLVLEGDRPARRSVRLMSVRTMTVFGLDSADELDLKTDDAGRFSVTNLTPGPWQISFDGDSPEVLKIAAGVTERTFQLSDSDGTITGKVADSSGNAVANAKVQIEEEEAPRRSRRHDSARGPDDPLLFEEKSTGYAGIFSRQNLRPGTYQVTARKDPNGGISRTETVTVGKGETRSVTLTLEEIGGTVVCTVLSGKTDEPLPHASLEVKGERGRYSARAGGDPEGIVKIKDLPSGPYVAQIAAVGYATVQRKVEVRPTQTVSLQEVLQPGSAVEIRVYDLAGIPQPEARIRLTPLGANILQDAIEGVADQWGRWTAEGVWAGRWRVTADTISNAQSTDDFRVWPGVAGDPVTVRVPSRPQD
jgi:protocatechuate 3,4-dioxygenase beta subunit